MKALKAPFRKRGTAATGGREIFSAELPHNNILYVKIKSFPAANNSVS
jgi:hypothetical protein